MATVHIPTPMRVATDGAARVQIEGATVREIVDRLESSYPGLGGRLVEDGQLRPGLSVFVDGANVGRRLRTKLQPDSELFFVEALGGGAPALNATPSPLPLGIPSLHPLPLGEGRVRVFAPAAHQGSGNRQLDFETSVLDSDLPRTGGSSE